jgi:hypothetical protein
MVKRIAKGLTTVNIRNAADIGKATTIVREMGLLHEI